MWDFDFTLEADGIIKAAIRVAVILVVALVVLFIAKRGIRNVVAVRIPKVREETPEQLADRSETIIRVVNQVVSVIVGAVALVMVLDEIGVNVAPLIAVLGLGALALGFAAQSLVRDYLNGLYILVEDWYRVGEVVNIAGIGGIVEGMSLRRTVLRDLNGAVNNIPHSNVQLGSNLTREWSRVNLNISVGYGENLDRVIDVINDVCRQLKEDSEFGPDLLTTPEAIRVDKLGDSGIEIKVLGDTKPMRQWGLTGELRKRIKDRFDQEGIEIPWPHTKVYFGNSPDNNGSSGNGA